MYAFRSLLVTSPYALDSLHDPSHYGDFDTVPPVQEIHIRTQANTNAQGSNIQRQILRLEEFSFLSLTLSSLCGRNRWHPALCRSRTAYTRTGRL
jgi:hypothetical protein